MTRRQFKQFWLVLAGASLVATMDYACARHVPPSLTPAGAIIFRANEAAHRLGQVQSVSIGLNGAGVLPTAQTKLVVQIISGSVQVIAKTPEGWRSTLSAALEQISKALTDSGNTALATYTNLARALLAVNDAERDLPGPLPTDDEMKAVFQSTIAHIVTEANWYLAANP